MTFLYDSRYSLVLLGPKNEVKLSTQSADKWICTGKWPLPCGAILLLRLHSERPKTFRFFQEVRLLPMGYSKKIAQTDEETGTKKIKLGPRGPIFAGFRPIFRFWVLLLKYHSTSGSRKLSSIPFNNMPNQAKKRKQKKCPP